MMNSVQKAGQSHLKVEPIQGSVCYCPIYQGFHPWLFIVKPLRGF